MRREPTVRFLRRLGTGACAALAPLLLLVLLGGPAWAPPHGPPTPPKPPTGVSAVGGNTVATVTWNPAVFSVYGYYPTGYVVSALVGRSPVQSCIAPVSALTCTLTGLTDGQRYKVDVRTTYVGRNFVPKESRPSPRVLVTPA